MPGYKLPTHGGNLAWASAQFGIDEREWLDMSTGISPWSWPVPNVPEWVYRNLPYQTQPLLRAAADYYGCDEQQLAIVPGSQYAIAQLPQRLPAGCVALPQWGYSEHAQCWQSAGHQPRFYQSFTELLNLCQGPCRYAVVINPNNPTGQFYSVEALTELERTLQTHQKAPALVIDEAFMDVCPEQSFIAHSTLQHTFILRSVGKFFGLAGLRLGFCFSHVNNIRELGTECGPWLVNHPALWLGERALQDSTWIAQQHSRIQYQATKLNALLSASLPNYQHRHAQLFHSVFGPRDELLRLFEAFAQHGILTRLIEQAPFAYLRLGLPAERWAQFENIFLKVIKNL